MTHSIYKVVVEAAVYMYDYQKILGLDKKIN